MFRRWRKIEIYWPNLIYKDILVLSHLHGLKSYAIIEPDTDIVDIPTYERISGNRVPRTITVYVKATQKEFSRVIDEAAHLVKPIYYSFFPLTNEDRTMTKLA